MWRKYLSNENSGRWRANIWTEEDGTNYIHLWNVRSIVFPRKGRGGCNDTRVAKFLKFSRPRKEVGGTLSLDISSKTRLALDSYYSGFAKWTTSRAYPARHARNFGTARMRIPTMSLTRAMWMSGRDVPRERDRRTFVPVHTDDFATVSCAKRRRIRVLSFCIRY